MEAATVSAIVKVGTWLLVWGCASVGLYGYYRGVDIFVTWVKPIVHTSEKEPQHDNEN